jgi:DNA (cytosine-5)-methyltransferase 1
MSKGNIVSLFSGAGGLDLGFKKSGYNIIFANDFDESIKPTYDANHDVDMTLGDLREMTAEDVPNCDGIIGGPPCQSWSLAGNMEGADDERGSVFLDYMDIIRQKQPKFFVTENVPGILSKKHINNFEEIVEEFEEMGYTVEWQKLNAAEYGVPQRRRRVFIIGWKEEENIDFEWPESTDEELTQYEAGLYKLPAPVASEGEPTDPEDIPLSNHEYYVGSYSSRYMSRNRVRGWHEPAYTVLANARHQKIHPKAPKMVKIEKDTWEFKQGDEDKYRRYSVLEASILQGFVSVEEVLDEHKDHFIFNYDKLNDGYKMIGNAVPVELAHRVANGFSF